MAGLQTRVARAADAALAGQGSVTFTDVLVGIGWLADVHVDAWRKGRIRDLYELVPVDSEQLHRALDGLHAWAENTEVEAREVVPPARSPQRGELHFGPRPDPVLEAAIRICWVRSDLPGPRQDRLVDQRSTAPDLVVIAPLREDWTCHQCGGSGDLLVMDGPGPACLRCADLDHLVFLAAGDAALTRRARKASTLSAVVVRFARARKRYERQGLLVERPALEAAEQSCLADQEARARRRERDAERRMVQDDEFVDQLKAAILRLFPGCPTGRAQAVAAWTGTPGSSRVGRSATGRALDQSAVELAVTASVRHEDTDYDALLMSGLPRAEARNRVRADVQAVLDRWRNAQRTTTGN